MTEKQELIFEKFKGRGRSYQPVVSIRKNGQIGFSVGVTQHYSLQKYNGYAILYFDSKNQVIGIKLSTEPKEGSYRFKVKSGSGAIVARAFFDYYKLPVHIAHRYILEWSKEHEMFLIHLNKPKLDVDTIIR